MMSNIQDQLLRLNHIFLSSVEYTALYLTLFILKLTAVFAEVL